MANPQEPFFVGWGKVPKGLRLFLASVVVMLVVGLGTLSYLSSVTQADDGSGAFMGPTNAIGILQTTPYPILHVIEGSHFDPGDTILLSGNGKRGAIDQAAGMDGQIVEARGFRLDRGELHGMQLRNGQRGLKPAEDQDQTGDVPIQKLGRWKLNGEICDGKCLGGAMRPGTGLSHRACATLCLTNDVAPVFVSSGPVDGSEFLLLSDADGNAVTPALLDYVALLIEVEGEVERHGSMLIFKISPETIRLAQ